MFSIFAHVTLNPGFQPPTELEAYLKRQRQMVKGPNGEDVAAYQELQFSSVSYLHHNPAHPSTHHHVKDSMLPLLGSTW